MALEATQIIGDYSFLIRPFQHSDNLDEYKNLYLECDNVLVKGLIEKDERLQKIGRNHVKRVFESDLSSFDTMSETFGKGKALLDKSGNEGELLRMCVSPHYRRIGLGSILVQHLLSYAAVNGFTQITLTTPSTNISAIHMYQKAGFVFVKNTLVDCGEDGEIEISTLLFSFVK